MNRRRLLATTASAVASVAVAGCLTDDEPGASTTDRSTTPDDGRPDTTSAPSDTTGQSTPTKTTDDDSFGWSEAANEPDPSKLIRLGNEGEDGLAHTVALEVYREATGTVVHDENHVIPANGEVKAYDTATANPDGIESFRVTCTFEEQTKTVTIETSECYGWAEFVVSAEDALRGTYTIC
ncbi:hypothetical protein [Halorubellus sp. PRR65]|uniref:hypothetical protein n=1 Tax=Halorubellus sp. PRR65 TaxID=3098148 RepID=UPI002B262D72|nr:hypothetical protein [Halorubellus sp. PRR65]